MSSVGQPLSLCGGMTACQDCWLADIQGWKQQTAPCQHGPTSASILLPSSLQGVGAGGWEQAQKCLCSHIFSKWDNSAASREKKKKKSLKLYVCSDARTNTKMKRRNTTNKNNSKWIELSACPFLPTEEK